MDKESIKKQIELIRKYIVEHNTNTQPKFDLMELESIIDTYVLMEKKLNRRYPKKGIEEIKAFVKEYHGLEIKEFEKEKEWKLKK